MGATLPADGYITDAGRTTGEVKGGVDDTLDVLRRLIGAVAAEVATISTGTIAPSGGLLLVENEGAVSTDFLDFLTPTPYDDGSVVQLIPKSSPNNTIIRHDQGTNGFVLNDATDWTMTGNHWIKFRWNAGTSKWRELSRGYGAGDEEAARIALGLGTVAVLNDGAVDAATLGGLARSGFYEVGDAVGDADTVDGIEAAGFVQTALTSLQEVGGNFKVNAGSLISNVNVGTDARLDLQVDDVTRGLVLYHEDGANSYMTFRVFDTDGATLLGEIRMVADGSNPTHSDGATTRTFMLIEDHPDLIEGTFATGSASGTLSDEDDNDTLNLNPRSFFPDIEVEDGVGGIGFLIQSVATPLANKDNVQIEITRISGGSFTNRDWDAEWEYFVAS